MAIYVEVIPNRSSPPAILLREAWRDGKKIRKKTLANRSKMPPEFVDAIRATLEGGVMYASINDAIKIHRALPHGHVVAALETLRSLGLVELLGRKADRRRTLAVAAIVARVIDPASRMATTCGTLQETVTSSLGTVLDLGHVSEDEMLAMLDWLVKQQPRVEKSLANRHLTEGKPLVVHDVSTSFIERRQRPFAAFGHSRGGKKGKKRITYGLLCASDGCPVAVEVFAGNTGDPSAVASQVERVRSRFGLDRIAMVGDPGMLNTARIRKDLKPVNLDWISALKTSDIRKLLRRSDLEKSAPLVPEESVPDAVTEVTSPEFPDERLIICLNPRLREERARMRDELLTATEVALATIAKSVKSGRLKGSEAINCRVGRDVNRRKVEKHFTITVTDNSIAWSRREDRIEEESRLDGIYVVRTSLRRDAIGSREAVTAYTNIAQVERAFPTLDAPEMSLHPVRACSEDHVRAHAFLCMLACHVEWHLRQRLAPLLCEDDDCELEGPELFSPKKPVAVTKCAEAEPAVDQTAKDVPFHSLKTLLADLATLTLNEVTMPSSPDHPVPLLVQPTPLQSRAFKLLDVDLATDVSM